MVFFVFFLHFAFENRNLSLTKKNASSIEKKKEKENIIFVESFLIMARMQIRYTA